MEEIIAFANIAHRCLNSSGRNRPTMKQVVAELESTLNTNGSPSAEHYEHYEDAEYEISELDESSESGIPSTYTSSTVYQSYSVELESIRDTIGSPFAEEHYEEDEYGTDEPLESDVTFISTTSTVYHSLSVELEPLLTKQ
ncbi:hypothetical protein AgCh_027170 [Apium graveolens]